MFIRVTGMLGLIIAKALVGHEIVHPLEVGGDILEICAVFAAGFHIAHHHGKEHHHA